MIGKLKIILKTKKITSVIALLFLFAMAVGLSFAFIRRQESGTPTNDISVTSNTTDYLSFQVSNNIEFRVTQADFVEGGHNKSGESTATAILTPNNKTNAGTMNYYMYLNLTSNPTIYSNANTNHDPELMLQVFDENNELVELTGLGSQKTIKGVTGYDITGRQGLITLLSNHAITANGSTVAENWSIVITLVNLNIDQNDNTNKTITGEVILRKDQQLDSPRIAVIVPQQTNNVTKGYVETVIEPSFDQNEEEVYTIYTVGYIADDTINGVTYSIDIENMGIDFSTYDLELVGTPQVMTSQADYTNYVLMKTNGIPLTSLSNGDTNKAAATAQELYTYSLNASELTINRVKISCDTTKCTATITEIFNNISGKSKHSTINSNNEAINVLYNGIKFNVKIVEKALSNIDALQKKYNLSSAGNITLANGYIYYHGSSLTNGANDGSYRYAGANPNNYVCFGSDAETCPTGNIYRIIGIVPVDVVVDETTNPITTERQMLYKLIKNDYETSTTLGMTSPGNASKSSSYGGPSGNQPSGNIEGFYWRGTSSDYHYNFWNYSTLNTIGLNTNVYAKYSNKWKSMIAKVKWIVGGNTMDLVGRTSPMSSVYTYELISPARNDITNAKIGLMYASDYGYAAPQSAWTYILKGFTGDDYSISSIKSNNWLYRGVQEWSITPSTKYYENSFGVYNDGAFSESVAYSTTSGVRHTFYLTENTKIDMKNYDGTKNNPYRVM